MNKSKECCFILLTCILLVSGCVQGVEDGQNCNDDLIEMEVDVFLNTDSATVFRQLSLVDLENLANEFESRTLFYQDIDDYLGEARLDRVYASNAPELLDISKIFLLKLHKQFLQRSGQGYYLNGMSKGQSQVILDYYLMNTGIRSRTFLNSGIVYHYEKDKVQTNSLVIKLLNDIAVIPANY